MHQELAASLERLGESFAAGGPRERLRMLVIVNPYATTMSVRLKHLVVYALQGRYDVDAIDTQRRNHAEELCREAAREGYDVIVAFGGDGTVNEAANGLAGTTVPLTCLPGGATNVYCRMLGIPNDVVDAAEHLLRLADRWAPRPVDLGDVNGRKFTFSAGIGIDALVVDRVDRNPKLKARLGAYYFTYAAITTFMRRYIVNPPRLTVTADGTELKGVDVQVQNSDPYTYFKARPIALAKGNGIETGWLNGVTLDRANPIDMPFVLGRALSRSLKVENHRHVHAFGPVDRVEVTSDDDRLLPLQVDGDYVGEDERFVFTVQPGGLYVVA